ncbi:MAG TPA: DUF3426 domain-containing protein [Steroidobacteraceae bacterium]|jgi:predicted Zn finger-like uncharacterized protein|nr:DUF3426 domain-containing protein [Steroidobacteraceae bacterium]
MLTQCPNCQTTFRVTTEILRVADGQVRCGRCQTQFDALERLIDENEPGQQAAHSPRTTRAAASGPIEVEEQATQEDITLEGRHIEISGRYRMPDSPRGEPQIREEIVEEWVEIDDIDEATSDAGEIRVEEELIDDDEQPGEIEVVEEPAYEPAAEEEQEEAEGVEEEAQQVEDELLAAPPRPAIAPLWKILAGPLVLLLAIQFVHTYRHELARHPRLGPPIVGLYGAVGVNLQPDWDLHAYEILQWHLGSDPAMPGTLRVRASLKNVASFAQPYPLLKLVLEDRWGERVREREFDPSEYLDPATAPDRLLAPAQQATATISIVDPGPDAEGFRFDVCLRGRQGIVCAADVPDRK